MSMIRCTACGVEFDSDDTVRCACNEGFVNTDYDQTLEERVSVVEKRLESTIERLNTLELESRVRRPAGVM